jgi:23S rRNA pseudouridine1911/1915/1917 synthase
VGESPDYWVIDKQAGLVVHPAPGHWTGTLMNGLVHMDPELVHVPRAGIVHRLDCDTSGLMVVARNPESQVKLIQMLQARIVKRVYLALVWGKVNSPVTVNKPLGRDPRNRLRMAVVEFGKPAVTHFTPVLHGELLGVPVTAMVCRLETGRTHQIRVHAQHAGFALVTDPTYKLKGAGSQSALRLNEIALSDGSVFYRQALHAMHLSFPDPFEFVSPDDCASRKQWEAMLSEVSWPEFIAPPASDLMQLGEMAGLDLFGPEILHAVQLNASEHKASSLIRFESDAEDDFDDDDEGYDVEVVHVRDD